MTVETKENLNASTVKMLQELIRINLDSAQGFSEAAKEIKDLTVASLFREMAHDRAQFASLLKEYVMWNGESPMQQGSYAAAFHRIWIDLRARLNGGDAHVVLVEAERGEDQIKLAYEVALRETAGSAMNDVLTRQYAGIKAGHDRIRDLRDARAK